MPSILAKEKILEYKILKLSVNRGVTTSRINRDRRRKGWVRISDLSSSLTYNFLSISSWLHLWFCAKNSV